MPLIHKTESHPFRQFTKQVREVLGSYYVFRNESKPVVEYSRSDYGFTRSV